MIEDETPMVVCPGCGKGRPFVHKCNASKAIKTGAYCRRCANKGNRCYKYGQLLTQEIKDKISQSMIGKKHTTEHNSNISIGNHLRYLSDAARKETSELTKIAMHNPEIRGRHIKGLHHSKWLRVRTDKGQLELLEKWNRLGFKFEPNYQVHTDTDLFYVDGYDKEHRVVLEYDAKYHHKLSQKQKDLVRQTKIIDILKPNKFWRYDAVNKKCKNVIGE